MKIADTYTACSIVEGFADTVPTLKDELQAWAYLIKSGQCWHLQGWYGRQAQALIDEGYISKRGAITEQGKQLIREAL